MALGSVVSVSFVRLDGSPLPFTLQMYGIPFKEFLEVPCKWVPHMKEYLRRMGIDPDTVVSSPFMVREVHR